MALAGEIRPWPLPDDFMKEFRQWARNPDPATADQLKQLGHEIILDGELFDKAISSASTLTEVRRLGDAYYASKAK